MLASFMSISYVLFLVSEAEVILYIEECEVWEVTTSQAEKITNTLALLVGWKELDTLFWSNIRGTVEVNNIFLIVYYNFFVASILSSLNKFPLWLWLFPSWYR